MKSKKFAYQNKTIYILSGLSVIAVLFVILLLKPIPKPGSLPSDSTTTNATSTKLSTTDKSSAYFASEKKRWKKIFDESSDPKASYKQFLEEYGKKDLGVQHFTAHIVGGLLYEKLGNEGITICDGSFAYGCYHGVATQSIATNGVGAVNDLDDACVKIYGADKAYPCKHGIGHGLVEFFGHRDDKLIDALKACTTTYKEVGQGRYFGCYGGVFMEYNHPVTLSDNKAEMGLRPIDKNKPYYPCTDIPQEYQEACYNQLPQWWGRHFDNDYQKIGVLCSQVKDKLNKIGCYRGIGNIVAPQSKYEPYDAIKRCEKISDSEGEILCLQTTSWSIFVNGESLEKGQIVCQNLSPEDKKLCATDTKK